MKIEIQLPDETAAALLKTMARVKIPAHDIGRIVETAAMGINAECIGSVSECYVYPDSVTAEKVVSTVGRKFRGGETVDLSFRDGSKVVHRSFANPHGAKLRADRVEAEKERQSRISTAVLDHMEKVGLWPVLNTPDYLNKAAGEATSVELRMILLALAERGDREVAS